MSDCRQCGASLEESANFCPRCGAPQNRQASERLQSYVQSQVEKRRSADESASAAESTSLERRASYVVGYAGVVAALATLPSVAGGCFLLAGVSVLPPVRRVVGRALDRPVPPLAAAVVFAILAGGGVLALRFA